MLTALKLTATVVAGLVVIGFTQKAESTPPDNIEARYSIQDNTVTEFRLRSEPNVICVWIGTYSRGGLSCIRV